VWSVPRIIRGSKITEESVVAEKPRIKDTKGVVQSSVERGGAECLSVGYRHGN
jgi:hypothetical protein